MKLNIKAYPEQVVSKLEYGFKDIEIQLYKKIDNDTTKNLLEAINKGADIHIIHSALIPTSVEANTSISLKKMLCYEKMVNYIQDAFIVAEFCAHYLQHPVGVILHNGFTDSDTIYFPDKINAVISKVIEIYDRFKENTYILIENEPSFLKDFNGNKSFCEKGEEYSQGFVVESFNKRKITNVSTVIDTCHVMMDNTFQNRIFEENNNVDWDNVFRKMKLRNVPVGLIHLSRCEGDGLGKNHGLPFTEKTKEELYEILQARYKYYPESQITLEVYEDNYYAKPLNYITEMNLVNSWYEKHPSA